MKFTLILWIIFHLQLVQTYPHCSILFIYFDYAKVQFRSMWSDFEWENKVQVNTNFDDVNQFLSHIVKSTNMQCLTPASALAGECAFLSANLYLNTTTISYFVTKRRYAKSVFGEDALVNVCVERTSEGRIAGYIRIRSKTQGIALSLGDKITTLQKRV